MIYRTDSQCPSHIHTKRTQQWGTNLCETLESQTVLSHPMHLSTQHCHQLFRGFISSCLLSVSHGKMLNYTVLQQQCHFTKSRYLFHPPIKDVLRKECLKDTAISSSNIGEIHYIKKTVCSEYQNVEVLGYISNSYCYDIVFTFKQNSIIQHYFN